MANKIIFKGVDSSTITGLLISELPDITRPPRRQDVIEVAGRDGDVVNYLGYDTYKKTLQIGLFGDYDVDEISNFLSGEGWLTPSNEIDKKYYARIVDGINFERLLRFKTAKVNFIVQPYKKLVTEASVSGTSGPLAVENKGYIESRPTIIIAGDEGNIVTVVINGHSAFSVEIPAEGTITIDSEARNCFNSNADKNQYVTMDDDFPTLQAGNNTVDWVGDVDSVTVIPNSRWL